MQNAKDTFYISLRDRLAAFNPLRTIVVRGAVRPAILVAENELVAAAGPPDGFVLTWGEVALDLTEPLPLGTVVCDIAYATRGTTENLGMDRGRVLDAMDRELLTILQPASASKRSFGGDLVSTLKTNIFWSQPKFGAATAKDGQLARTVQLTLFTLQEGQD